MFLLDDILLAPMKGLAAVCRKVEEAARQDLENQGKGAMSALGELHRRLETGQIDEKNLIWRKHGCWKKSRDLREYSTKMMRQKTPDMQCCPAITPDERGERNRHEK